MNEKFKSEFDRIKASPQLKNQTLNHIYHPARPEKRHPYFKKMVITTLAIFIAVLFSFNYFNQTKAVMALSLDGDLAVELEVDSHDEVVKITGFDDSSNDLIKADDYLNDNYVEVINSLQNKVSNSLTISVAYFNDSAAVDSSLSDVVVTNANQIAAAHRYRVTFGKYHACQLLMEQNPDYDINECLKLSYNQVKMQIKNQEQNQNGNGDQSGNDSSNDGTNQSQNSQGNSSQGGSNQSSSGH